MCGVLALLFIVVPAAEIYVIIQIGQLIGPGATFGVIILTGIAGAALARSQGLEAWRQVQQSMTEGRRIGSSLVGAALVLAAGVMMLTPGFITDAVGLLLLLPPVRALIAPPLARRAGRRVVMMDGTGSPPPGAPRQRRDRDDGSDDEDPPPPGVIDV